jgi:hypothetical protein
MTSPKLAPPAGPRRGERDPFADLRAELEDVRRALDALANWLRHKDDDR